MSSQHAADRLGLITGLAVGCLVVLSACQPSARAPATTQQALDPILQDRPERLVDIDPTALYSEDQLAPLLFLQDGALPQTITPLTAEILDELTPEAITRIDLRLVHAPDRWPEETRPPGEAQVVRASYHADCGEGMPCGRRVAIQAGTSLQSRELTPAADHLQPLLESLDAGFFAYTREADPDTRAGTVDQPWLELRILTRSAAADRVLVPRQEIDAPRDALVAGAIEAPATENPQSLAPKPNTDSRWVDDDADGVPYVQAVDPGATLYTFTLSAPESADLARRLMPLAVLVDEHYLESGWDSPSASAVD